MRGHRSVLWLVGTVAAFGIAQAATAQETPSPYTPAKTEWGDPDLRGVWPLELLFMAGIPLERPESYGERSSMTDEEFARRLESAGRPRTIFALDDPDGFNSSLVEWLQSTLFGRRTSLIVDPPNGRLPPMTAQGSALYAAGRNSFKDGQPIDWIDDLDSYDRCITRNFAAVILPWPENNGVRVFQSPGFVVLQLEVLGTRIIPIAHGDRWPQPLRSWMGQSLGHWEGDTLVIETTAIVAGDSVSREVAKRASSPINGRPGGVMPMSERAKAVERLTMTSPDTLTYEVTYSDPEIFTAPWTVAVEWTRDDHYKLHEFACHEGNTLRDMITGSRAHRSGGDSLARGSGNAQQDGTGRWAFPRPEEEDSE